MNTSQYIDTLSKERDINILYEAASIEAWSQPRTTSREIATAMARNDPELLMDAMRAEYLAHVQNHAEECGVALDDVGQGEHMDSAIAASAIIDRDNARAINATQAANEYYGYMGTG